MRRYWLARNVIISFYWHSLSMNAMQSLMHTYIDRYDNFHWLHFVNYINETTNEIVCARIKAQFVLDINLHLHTVANPFCVCLFIF